MKISSISKRTWILIGVGIVVLILVGVGAYFLYKQYEAKKVPVLTPIQIEAKHKAALEALPANPSKQDVTPQQKMNLLKTLSPAPTSTQPTK